MNKIVVIIMLFSISLVIFVSCSKTEPAAPEADSILDGTVDGLTYEQAAIHSRGDAAFNNDVFTITTGLGPIFVATSCGSCHAGDGKGHPFTTLTRFGQTDSTGNRYLQLGGPQLQDRAVPGYEPEQIPAGATYARFTPPANTGLGFLELVPDQTLLFLSDPADANGDGISGKPNWISIPAFAIPAADAVINNEKYIGRFGKKASVYNLLQQTVNAYNQDMGIASAFEPADVHSGLPVDPEITINKIYDVVFYIQTLKAPIQRSQNDAAVAAGKQIFININCSGCHTPALTTGFSPVQSLSFKSFAAYTDLLLHNMGAALDDGYTEGTAATSEWRTAPLWGLGLSPNAQGGQYFLMHDGRAHSIEAAIQLHGGEATRSKDNFNTLSAADKSKLITFLQSL